MPSRTEIRARAAVLRAGFEAAGAEVVELPLLQPADTLLDLYGEDIRARAYVISDALRGEQMLRPDFTVPVVQFHLDRNVSEARYTYTGDVFRRQENDPDRESEYIQVGYEVFDSRDPAAADAEVFARIASAVAPLGLRASTGDIGILMAAVGGLRTSEARRSALLRHIWRPRRFRALLERYAGHIDPPAVADPRVAAPLIGKRRAEEITARLDALRTDADVPPISENEVALIEALLAVRETVPYALAQLRDIAVDLTAIGPSVEQLARRAVALANQGIAVDDLDFEASYGRTTLEYYDGFVFGFSAETRPDLPPVATGGRYDALTRRLGGGRDIRAVGGVLRPGLMAELEAAQ